MKTEAGFVNDSQNIEIREDEISDFNPRGSDWYVDIEKLNRLWPGDRTIRKVEDAFTVRVILGDKYSIEVPTHLFGDKTVIIPYADEDNIIDASGNPIERGDSEIAKYYLPGEIGYAIKHHRPAHRILAPENASPEINEDIKLQDTHIEMVIGVERDSQPGAVTLNSPQDYQNGRFGDPNYPMIFIKPDYPDYLTGDLQKAFNDNIRSMMLAFNAVSDFPGNYNGGDPLGVWNIEKVTEHCKKMVLAIAGDESVSSEALAWFQRPENLIYCAELAHVASSAGLFLPLNDETFVPLVGEMTWKRFIDICRDHNNGMKTPFVDLNRNKLAALVKFQIAPESLRPVFKYAPDGEQTTEARKLAFKPMTMADILEQAIRSYFPREDIGEELAPIQAIILETMRPGLIKMLGMDTLPENDPRRQTVEELYSAIVDVTGRQYHDYSAFRKALEPHLEAARMITGPRPGTQTGEGFFVPPSLLHLVAQKKYGGGILGLNYIGHGLHFSLVHK